MRNDRIGSYESASVNGKCSIRRCLNLFKLSACLMTQTGAEGHEAQPDPDRTSRNRAFTTPEITFVLNPLGPHVTAFADEIGDDPQCFFSLLEIFGGEPR